MHALTFDMHFHIRGARSGSMIGAEEYWSSTDWFLGGILDRYSDQHALWLRSSKRRGGMDKIG